MDVPWLSAYTDAARSGAHAFNFVQLDQITRALTTINERAKLASTADFLAFLKEFFLY